MASDVSQLDAEVIAALDPGIRDTVVWLRSCGFETVDSGDGVSKPRNERVFDVPHVVCVVRRCGDMFDEVTRLTEALGSKWYVEGLYLDGRALIQASKTGPGTVHCGEFFDLIDHLHRQAAFSLRTFGPGARTKMVCDHIEKEIAEIRQSPGDLEEWADVILLALDGAWRTGATPEAIANAIDAKLRKNENRAWPDWRTADPDKAIEHVRTGETP